MASASTSTPDRRGVALIFVIGALILLGLLVTLLVEQVRGIDDLSFRDHAQTQKTDLLESAVSYCRLRWSRDSLLGAETWSDMVWLDPGKVGFRAEARPWGALVRLVVRMFLGTDTGTVRSVLVGGSAREDSLPSLGVVESGQNLTILQGSSLNGSYWGNGAVESPFGFMVSQVTSKPDQFLANRSILPRTEIAETWWASADSAWRRGTPLDTSVAFVHMRGDTCDLAGAVQDTEFRCDGLLRIRDARLSNVTTLSKRLLVEDQVDAENVLLAARTSATIRGSLHLRGQILAEDSLAILADSVDGAFGLFHLLGVARPNPNLPSDSVSSSLVQIATRWGRGEVVYAGGHQGSSQRQVHFLSSPTTNWNGIWISQGESEVHGRLEGTAIVQLLVYHDRKGVPWEGRLDSVTLKGVSGAGIRVLPWTGRGEPSVWGMR